MKAPNKEVKEFFEWIRKEPCWFGQHGSENPCTQNWNIDKGEFVSEVSHIMRKGSTRRGFHFGNVFPNCRFHHHWFEGLNPEDRETFLYVGTEYKKKFEEHCYETDRKKMWDEVRKIQGDV